MIPAAALRRRGGREWGVVRASVFKRRSLAGGGLGEEAARGGREARAVAGRRLGALPVPAIAHRLMGLQYIGSIWTIWLAAQRLPARRDGDKCVC